MININELIKKAILDKNQIKLDTYRMLKSAILEFQKAKNAQEFNEDVELKIIKKMIKQRQEVAQVYKQSGRDDLAATELAQSVVLRDLLPLEK